MLIQDWRLRDLRVRVYSEPCTDGEILRVLVTRGNSGGIAQLELPAGGTPQDRERVINLVTATAIREICAELDGKENDS